MALNVWDCDYFPGKNMDKERSKLCQKIIMIFAAIVRATK